MAITVTESATYPVGWVVLGASADASGCETLKAAVSGASHYIRGFAVSSSANISVAVGEDASGAAVVTPFATVYLTGDDGLFSHRFASPIRLTPNTPLVVDASGAGNIAVIVEGYTA